MPFTSAAFGSRAEIEVRCDARWLMAHAAAVGAFADVHFDTERADGIIAHPLFTVAPEWDLLTRNLDPFGLALTRDERASGVHAIHRVTIHRPVIAGDALRLTGEVVGMETLPSGALVTVRFDAIAADGTTVWTSWMGTIYRGVAIDGGDRPASLPPLPIVSENARRGETAVAIAEGAAHVYTECARIWNPIHTDVAVARRAGLPDIILHGTATLAHGVNAAMAHAGLSPEEVTGISGSFRAMVLLPSTQQITLRDDGHGACAFDVSVDGRPAVKDGLVTYVRRGRAEERPLGTLTG